MPAYHQESFTREEKQVLERFFTNSDQPVFALINLPEVVKGALTFGRITVNAVKGGLDVVDDEADDIAVIATAAIVVRIDLP